MLANILAYGIPLAIVIGTFWWADRRLPRQQPRTMRQCAQDAELAAARHGQLS